MIHHNEHPTQEPAATVLYTRGIDDYRVMADAMPQIVYIARADGACDYINQRWYEYTGASPEAALGFGWINHLHPEDYARTLVCWEQAFSSGNPFEIEYRLRNGRGEYLWHLSRAQPVYNEAQQITHWIGTATDIHSRKQAVATLEASEQRFRLAQKAGGIVSWEWNLATNVAFWSDGYASLFGYDPAKTQTPNFTHWMQCIHPSDRPQVQQAFQCVLDTGEGFHSEFRVVWPNGSIHWLMAQGELMSHADQSQWLCGVIFDRTQARTKADELAHSEARYRALIEASNQVVWSWDMATQSGQFFDAWRWWEKITGQSPQAQAGFGWVDVVHPEERERVQALCNNAQKNGTEYQTEYRVRNQAGRYTHIAERVVAIRGPDGVVYELVGTLTDVTEQRDAERQAAENLRLFQHIAEATPNILYLYDVQTRHIAYVNQALPQILGYTTEQIQAMGEKLLPMLFHPDDHHRMQAGHEQSKLGQDNQIIEHEYRLLHADGTYRWLHMRSLIFSRTADQKVGQVLGVAEDVTEQKRTAEALQASNQKIAAILASISDSFTTIDRSWRVTYANQQAINTVHRVTEELIGCNVWALFPQLLGTPIETAYRRAMDESIPTQVEIQGFITGIWYEAKVYPSAEGISVYGQDISKRKQAIEALQVSEERFAKAFRASPYVLHISHQLDGAIQEVNQGWEKLFGYSQAEAIGRTVLDLKLYANPSDRQSVLSQVKAQGFVRDVKVNVHDRWGKTHYISLSVEEIVVNGEPCWLTLVQDLTERKRAEERFHQLIEYAPNGIVMVDTAGNIQLVNAQVEQLFGYTRQALLGQSVEMLVPLDVRPTHPSYRQGFTAHSIPRPMGAGRDLFGLHKDGYTIPVEIGLNPIETMDGRMTLATIVDISPRKRAEVILRQSEERLRLATEAGRIGIFDHDIRTGQTQFSPLYCEIAHFPADQPPTTEKWLARVHPEDRAFVEKRTEYTKAEEQSYHYEYRIMLPDQSIRWLEASTFVAKDAQGQPVRLTGAVRDITERKQSEDLLRDANKILEQRVLARTAQLEAANQELEAFTYSVSHDLRAPLRAMGSFAEILLDQLATELADKPRHYLQRIRYNAQQMGQLIDDLLAFSRLSRQPLQKQTIAPAALVEQVLTDLSLEQEHRTIDITLAALPTCQADPNLLRQVFANLLENALKYTRKRAQAKIEIGWQLMPVTDGHSPEPVYFVRDNGVGFDMRYVDKLFGVFQRLHSSEEYEGTGVGLATVQRIIHRHGGQIWAQAAVDKGASFYFSLGQAEPGDEPSSNRKG